MMEINLNIKEFKKRMKGVVPYFVLLILFLLFINYIFRHTEDFKQLTIVSPEYLILLMILIFVLAFFNGLAIKYAVALFDVKLKIKEWFGLSVATTFYNLITPFRGGGIAQAAYLKKKHNLRYTHFLSGFTAIYIVTFFLGALIGIITLFLMYEFYGFFSWIVFSIFLFFLIFLFGILLFSPNFPMTRYSFINKLIEILNGWHSLRKNSRLIFSFIFVILAQFIVEALILILQFKLFNVHISLIQGFFLSTLVYIGLLLSVTPGGLGIHEAIVVFSAGIMGIIPAISIASSILKRAAEAIVISVLGIFFSYILLKEPNNSGNYAAGRKRVK